MMEKLHHYKIEVCHIVGPPEEYYYVSQILQNITRTRLTIKFNYILKEAFKTD